MNKNISDDISLLPYKNCKAHKQWVYISNDEKPYRPCCYFKTHIEAKDYQDYQEQLSKLDIASNCEYCIDLEKNGNPYSQRKEAEDTIQENEFRVTVAFDNLCNFKCVYCSPRYSTQIAHEDKNSQKLYKIISERGPSKLEFIKTALSQQVNIFTELIKQQGIHHDISININILGGEPLINPVVFDFLDWLSEQPYASHTGISFLTNGSTYNDKIYDYSRKFKSVGLGFSIDGTEDIFEYIRCNGKWAEVKNNIDRYYQLQDDRFKIAFQYALTWMNISGFSEWYNWIVSSYPNLDEDTAIHMNKVVYPEYQSVDVIPPKGKQIIIDKIEKQIINTTEPKFLSIFEKFKIQVLTGSDKSQKFNEALRYFDELDNIRDTNHQKVLKEVMDIIKETKEFPKNFCSLPWLQIHTEPDGKVMPCCYFSHEANHRLGNWKENTLKNIFNSEKWNKLRKEFLDGKRPDGCFRCWKEEDSGIVSMRQSFNERYQNWPDYEHNKFTNKFHDIVKQTNEDGRVGDIKLATIDLIFNNLCNFKCRSCGPGLSTSWAAEGIKLGRMAPTFVTNAEISHMKDDLVNLVNMVDPFTEIHFSGGEPMMQEEHYEFLKLLIDMDKTKVKIRYNTNLSTFKVKDYNAFELLRNFDNVFIIGSIDAMGNKGEYIRKGFNWEESLNWIKTCKEHIPTIDLGISAVYSLFNCEAAIDLHKFICENDLFKKHTGDTFGFNLNVLHFPEYIRTTILPAETKKRVTEKITNHLKWLENTQPKNSDYRVYTEHWKNAMTLMNSADESHLIEKFFYETGRLDVLRNESFKDIFPELYEDLVKYGKRV